MNIVTPDQALANAVTQHVAMGYRIESMTGNQAVMVKPANVNHILHLLLTLLLFGLWAIVWIIVAATTAYGIKKVFTYQDHKHICQSGSSNRIDEAVYLVGEIQRSGMYQWKKGMIISELIEDAGGIRVPRTAHPDQTNLAYTVYVQRPTDSDPNPSSSCHQVVVFARNSHGLTNATFRLLPQDLVSVVRSW